MSGRLSYYSVKTKFRARGPQQATEATAKLKFYDFVEKRVKLG